MSNAVETPAEQYRREAEAFDVETWRRLTPRQAETFRRFGPRRRVLSDDPIPEVPYDERTVRQVIYTFAKLNPAWDAMVVQKTSAYSLARTLAFVARSWGVGLDVVLGRRLANRLEQFLEDYATDWFTTEPQELQNLRYEEREAWFAAREHAGADS